MSGPPTVTVLVPARNEQADIGACIASIAAQDYPLDRMEVIIVDGGSSDRTGDVAAKALGESPLVVHRIVTNPIGSTPSNLNAGLAVASGTIVVRVDARSSIPPDYVRRCAEILSDRPDVKVVGGAQVALARDTSAQAIGIARALNNRWGMGLSRYRRAADSGATDTVYLGVFRTEELRAVGGWDERLTTNQDFELNRRLSANGAVWFESGLEVGYVPRATFGALWRQYRRFGEGKVRYWHLSGDPPRPRQLVLLASPVVGAAGVVLLARLGWRGRVRALTTAMAGAVVIEVRGSSGPDGSPSAHAAAILALVLVGGGWLRGVWGTVVARALGRHGQGAVRVVAR